MEISIEGVVYVSVLGEGDRVVEMETSVLTVVPELASTDRGMDTRG